MKIRYMKKLLGLTLVGSVAITSLGLTPVQAATENTEKEEVVYGMLDANGDVSGVYVVNIFKNQSQIRDYGDYTDVKNLTTTDEISYSNGTVTIETDSDSLYYQGDLETIDLPWNIAIHYYMDGTEYSPEEIAGMSGSLKISIDITENTNCDESFWKGYALQATLTLDSDMAQNIQAEDATIANVGSDKQLSYIILPGNEESLEITADVRDFEMDAIEINGVKLDLSVDYDDSQLMDQVEEIQDAVEELNDGASDLEDGADELCDGSQTLSTGASNLNTGMSSLNSGISQIYSGLSQLNGQSDDLTDGSAEVLGALETIQTSLENVSLDAESLSTLSTASSSIKTGIDNLVLALQTMDGSIDTYYATLSGAGISDASTFANQNTQAAAALSAINTGGQYDSIIALLQADASYIQGSDSLISGISDSLDSTDGSLMTGALALQTNYDTFDENIQSMVDSLGSLSGNMATLKSGIDQLVANYSKLDGGINDYTEAVAKIVAGYEKIYSGSNTLASATSQLYDGTTDLLDGALALYEGTEEMSEGTNTFQDETADLDTEITEKIDEKIQELTGSDVETVSYVSDKNTNIDSVLFVMKTSAIQQEEAEAEEETTTEDATSGFWEKFLALFHLT